LPLTKVSAGVIAANAVVDSFGTQSITGDKLGLTAINANNIVNASITGAKLAANTVSGDVIGQNAISSNNIVSVNASVATVGTLPTARLPTGSVLQVVNSVKTTTQSTTSSSYVDITDLSVTITPTSATSKILVMARINHIGESAANGAFVNLVRGATTIVDSTAGGLTDTYNAWASGGAGGMSNNDRKITACSLDYLDSPNTTSATTYKMQMRADGTTVYVNRWGLNNDIASVSSITVMEIAA